ncbi:hypothetical protein [Streptomyces sp. RKAG337]|uniref:hypothetical protein n=1 Tax=Streptomyces sp. RKAG337 TaxID=2893404 RepID=UPI002034128B|nr:hypothetical protein [Streptomyces sp. RKAG337]MCM2431044.1 hypothetical protein [Streptomyces sp. RKAG337]
MTERNTDTPSPASPDPARTVIAPRSPADQDHSAQERLLRDLKLAGGEPSGRPALRALGGLGTYENEFVVDLDAELRGRDVRTARDVLKRADLYGLRIHDVTGPLNFTEAETLAYLRRLVRAGLLSGPTGNDGRTDSWDRHDHRTWKLTPAGRVLANASGRRPSTRRSADTLVAKIVKAAAQINDDPDATLWWVEEIRALGAYAAPGTDPLLHVDLAVRLRPRLNDRHEQAKAEQRLHDAAEDRGERAKARDMLGYGHWKTRLALAGRSKVVRLFAPYEDTEGPVLFREERDLTLQAQTTAPYTEPPEPQPLPQCSWCRRALPGQRVARPGEAFTSSPIGLCETCLILGGAAESSEYRWWGRAGRMARETVTALASEPHHPNGCAMCGRTAAEPRPWWTAPDPDDQDDRVLTELRMCDLCPGLLELVDDPARDTWWARRFHDACLTGMHARLRQETGQPPATATKARPRRPARLTDVHQEILDEVRRSGALETVDLVRDARDQDAPHHRWSWWDSRIGHLLDHELLTPITTIDGTHHSTTRTRILEDDERELRRGVLAAHVPGPVWDGDRVTEPAPPEGWDALNSELTALRTLRDEQALSLRRQVRPATRTPYPVR